MHLCRDRGFPDLLRAVRRLLGWENARGLRREIFCPFPAAVTVIWTSPFPNPSDIGIPFSYYLSDLGQGYSRLPTSRPLKFLARKAKEKKRASKRLRSNRARPRGSRAQGITSQEKKAKGLLESQGYRGCPYYCDIAANFCRSRASYFSPQPPSPFLDLVFATLLLQWNPVNTDTKRTCHSVRIIRVSVLSGLSEKTSGTHVLSI